jgi:flagellar hook-associated protein 2
MSTVPPTTGSIASTVAATTAASNQALQEAAQSIISGSTGNSSVDINSLVTALVNEKIAGQAATLSAQQSLDNTEISAYGTLSAALSALQASLTTLSNGQMLNDFSATASGTGLTATAGAGAVAGSYSVDVAQVASAQVLTSEGLDAASPLGTGTLTLSVGGKSSTITIDNSNNTVSGIAAAINGASDNPGITATVVTGSDGAHLVLHSTSTGAANTINVTVNQTTAGTGSATLNDFAVQSTAGSTPTESTIGDPTTLTGNPSSIPASSSMWKQTTAAQDAYFTIDNTPVTSSTNTVTSALNGVTLNLSAAAVDTDGKSAQTLTLAQDTTSQASSINEFVSLYNTLVTTTGTLTTYNSASSTQGPLLGDSTLNSIQRQLSTIVATGVKNGNTTTSLASIGISLQADGTLSVDSTKLTTALQSNQSTVAALFDSTTGVAAQLNTEITGYLSPTGDIATRTTALNTDLTSVTTQQKSLVAYQTQLTSMYNAQFTSLNTLMATMNNNQQYLTQLFGGQNSAGALSTAANG